VFVVRAQAGRGRARDCQQHQLFHQPGVADVCVAQEIEAAGDDIVPDAIAIIGRGGSGGGGGGLVWSQIAGGSIWTRDAGAEGGRGFCADGGGGRGVLWSDPVAESAGSV